MAREQSSEEARIAELEKRVAAAEDEARFRAKYGNPTPAQAEIHRAGEAREAARKARHAERERARYAERKAMERWGGEFASTLERTGRARVYLRRERIHPTAAGGFSCPLCGAEIPDVRRLLEAAAARVAVGYAHPRREEPALWDEKIFEVINNLTTEGGCKCPSCGATARGTIILVPE